MLQYTVQIESMSQVQLLMIENLLKRKGEGVNGILFILQNEQMKICIHPFYGFHITFFTKAHSFNCLAFLCRFNISLPQITCFI